MAQGTLAERLHAFRAARNLTPQDLADLIGVSRITILRWETGTSKPKGQTAEKLEEIGFGKIEKSDTKHSSIPRLTLQPERREELRADIRQTLAVNGKSIPFEPSPFVVNGPSDQLQFFEVLFGLQEHTVISCSESEYLQRLALVATVSDENIPTSQYLLEKPKANSRSWSSNYGSHGWHRYIGRFPPHVVRALINHFDAKPGDVVLDPFVGSGTTLVECRLLGIKAIGIEITPLSSLISRAKSQFPTDVNYLVKLVAVFEEFYQQRWSQFLQDRDLTTLPYEEIINRPGNSVPMFANYEKWFTKEALLGVSIVVEFAQSVEGYHRDFVCCALSANMRSIGNVDVDVVRAEYRKKPRLNVDVLKLVSRWMKRMTSDIQEMVSSHVHLIADPTNIEVIENDILDTDFPAHSVDFIITSPPYGVEASSYIRTHLLSYRTLQPILNYDPYSTNKKIIGSEYADGDFSPISSLKTAHISPSYVEFFEQQYESGISAKVVSRNSMMMRFFDEMVESSRLFSKWLRPNGRIAFIVGNKRIGNTLVPTDKIIAEIFGAMGLRLDQVISQKLKTNNSNSEVPWQERTIQDEFIMLFTKTDDM